MAGRIPQYEATVGAQADRRVISTPVLNQDVGEGDALRAVGGAIDAGVELAVKLETANQDRQITTADRVAREKLDRLKFDLENTSPDVADEDLKKRYQEQSEAAIQEAGKTIANPRARDIFTERARGYQSEGALWTDRLGLKRGVDRTRAGHVTAITEIDAKAGDVAIKRETFLEDIAGEKAAVERARQLGVYTQEQAAELNAKLDGIAVKDNTMRFGANVDALVKDGRIAEARAAYQAQMGLNASEKLVDRVDPDVLAKISAGLEANEQEYAVVERGDTIWTQSAGDYGKAIALAGEIKDAPLRLKVEARINQKAAQAKASEDARQDTLENAMWAHVEGGGTIMNAAPSLRGDISPSRLGAIRAYENARDAATMMTAIQKAQHAALSKDWRDELQSTSAMPATVFMGEPSKWSPRDYAKYQALTPEDQNAIRAAQRDMRDKGQSYSEVSKIENQLIDLAKVVAGKDWGLSADYRSRPEKADKLLGALRGQALALAPASGGRPLSVDEVQRAVALALKSAGETSSDFVKWQSFSMNVDPEFAANRMDTMEYDAAFNDLKTAGGQDPTFEEVQELLAIRRRASQ